MTENTEDKNASDTCPWCGGKLVEITLVKLGAIISYNYAAIECRMCNYWRQREN